MRVNWRGESMVEYWSRILDRVNKAIQRRDSGHERSMLLYNRKVAEAGLLGALKEDE